MIETADDGDLAGPLICQLQAAQLKDTVSGFDADIGLIGRSLATLLSDATGIVGHGRSIYDSQDGNTSFLAAMKQTLAQASILIGTCESARKSVDDALSVVEETLGNFRRAISGLSETVVDIILIGMNAGLRAGHLGTKGSAFVVIANELKATADHISGGAKLLKPILDSIERSANDLKNVRVDGDPSRLAELEPSILHVIQEIEAGNDHLGRLMDRLVNEGAQFECLMTGAQTLLSALGDASATLPSAALRLQSCGETREPLPPDAAAGIAQMFEGLYAQYTMVGERDVHLQFLARSGLPHKTPALESQVKDDSTEDVLFF